MIKRLSTADEQFTKQLGALIAYEQTMDTTLSTTVRNIIDAVRTDGDAALQQMSIQFDRFNPTPLRISTERLHNSYNVLPSKVQQALKTAAQRIERYHQRQLQQDWSYEEDNIRLGQQITPLDSVGLYVPGGKAAYPSTVLMNAIPAKVAGVKRLAMVTPCPDGVFNDAVLGAAFVADVDEVYCVGGAHAVAALAYGTQSIQAVDKIVGPGNVFVAEAKRQVFGKVGIDMIAGPSEITILTDGSLDPVWAAMDLFSQAEHDQQAQSLLLCDDEAYLDNVETALNQLLTTMPRQDIIRESLHSRGALILTKSIDEGIELVNRIAPEHLELAVPQPEELLKNIKHAGAIFMGNMTPEVLGDYCLGPNHVLPTAGTARFSSPLGTYDFQKRSSLMFVQSGAATLYNTSATLADYEALPAHAEAARLRLRTL